MILLRKLLTSCPSAGDGRFEDAEKSDFQALIIWQPRQSLGFLPSRAHHPQTRQGKQRGQLRRIHGQVTKAGFHIAELALDHMEWMLDLRSRLRFDLLDLASGFV